jgi:plastocyanin
MTRPLRQGRGSPTAAAVAAALAVAACSSDDSTSPAAAPSSAAAPSAPATTSAPGGGESSGESSGEASESSEPAGEGGTITIQNFRFGDPLTVSPGARVTVVNEDTAGHDAVSDDGLFKTPVLGKGERATFTAPTKPGTYKYSCSVHPGSMSGIGTLVVEG